MKLYFYGADRCVTGSCHMLEAAGKRILVDCGLQQGQDEFDNSDLPFHPGTVDYVLVTHAHIDHSGRLPLLIKRGFQGRIVTTRLTAELLGIMLLDSAHIQESDAEYQNRKGQRAGREMVEPLYTVADAERVQEFIQPCEYGQEVALCEGVRVRFTDAGHLLGSGSVTVSVTEGGVTKDIVFSGDIGNNDQPIIRDPQPLERADYVVMESTYGDRNHEKPKSYTADLARIIDETISRGGNVVIPAFAVGRTQELLYFIREIKAENMAPRAGNFPVYIDSPLAQKSTHIFCGDLRNYLDEEALELVKDGEAMFRFPGLYMTTTSEESKNLNADPTPKVIISASGMCDAGRIRHHLKHNLWNPKSTVVFVGFQSPGSLGRRLLDGVESVKLFGEEIAVRAEIVNFQGLSSHADHDHLLQWVEHFAPKPQHIFVVHGDEDVAPAFAQELTDKGYAAHAPLYLECYDLLADAVAEKGIVRRRPEKKAISGESPAYQRLLEAGRKVAESIRNARGRDNKSLNAFARKLLELVEWFEK
ncbi:MAG: MBL fold metallo-hydrolase RNA specificity domain-containing protein [Oscillospiraceae bacterium]